MAYGRHPRWPSPSPPPSPRSPDPPAQPARSSRLRAAANRAAEVSVAVAASLLFFGSFLALLTAVFPEGTGLRDLIGHGARTSSWEDTRVGRLGGTGLEPGRARLTVLSRGVSWKPATEIAWGAAETGLMLRERDGVQTNHNGEAVVAFARSSEIRLGPNTMIVVREPGAEDGSGSALVMLEGQAWGRFTPEGGEGRSLQLEASGAMARIASGTVGRGPGFKVSVTRDRGTTFSMYSGEAEIRAGTRTVRVGANRYVTVDSTGIAASGELPARPAPIVPDPEARFAFRSVPPEVTFAWRPVDGATAYRLVLARDPEFLKVLLDEVIPRTEFRHGNLSAGPVYWHVSALRRDVEGAPSDVRALRMVQRGGGPDLHVELPRGAVRAGTWVLSGETQPGATVYIGGAQVPVDGHGRFRREIHLSPGVNVLVVEAVDALGNTSYESGVVNAR